MTNTSRKVAANDTSSLAPEEAPFERMPGGRQTTRETYVDLHEHSVRLGHLARWDRAAPLLALGTLILGAGVGAWVAGEDFASAGVLASVCGGLGLLAGGLLLREERVKSAGDLHKEFEMRLALYEDDPKVQAIQERYRKKEREAFEKTFRGLAVRAFRKYVRYRQARKAEKITK